MARDIPANLDIRPPNCSICEGELYWDEDWNCGNCEASWNDGGDFQFWYDAHAEQCTYRQYWISDPLNFDRCILAKDHEGLHASRYGLGYNFTEWKDGD